MLCFVEAGCEDVSWLSFNDLRKEVVVMVGCNNVEVLKRDEMNRMKDTAFSVENNEGGIDQSQSLVFSDKTKSVSLLFAATI